MKIETEIKEGTAGFFGKKVHVLTLSTTFTEEEKAQIEKVGLTKKHDTNAFVKNINGTGIAIFLHHQLEGRTYTFKDADLTVVTRVQNRILSGLKDIKDHLNAVAATGPKTYEL